jgi:hypothetical protein
MRALFRTCIGANCVSALTFIIVANTSLALTTAGYCIVLFTVPYHRPEFGCAQLDVGTDSSSSWAISTLSAVALWVALLLKRRSEQDG